MRSRKWLIIGGLVLVAMTGSRVYGDWSLDPSENVFIKQWRHDPLAVTDGAGGAIVATWSDTSYAGETYRISADGLVLWTNEMLQTISHNVSDGASGCVVIGSGNAYRINGSGSTVWGPVSLGWETPGGSAAASDGTGGAYYAWVATGPNRLMVNRVDGAGNAWGSAVQICSLTDYQAYPRVVADGAGGAVIAWHDDRSLGTAKDVYFQRVNAAGTKLWTPSDGVRFAAMSNQTWSIFGPVMTGDGTGGALVAWEEGFYGESDIDIRAIRINGSGAFPWLPQSRIINQSTGNQVNPRVTSDGAGGMIVAWTDGRGGGGDADIYANRMSGSGVFAWSNEVTVCDAVGVQELASGPPNGVTGDGAGGVLLAWRDARSGGVDLYAQKIDAAGFTQWTSDGVPVCTADDDQTDPALVADGAGGAILAWEDWRAPSSIDPDLYAQRVHVNGTLALRVNVYDAWWTQQVDLDGDGYFSRGTLTWDVDANQPDAWVFEEIWREAGEFMGQPIYFRELVTDPHLIHGAAWEVQEAVFGGYEHDLYNWIIKVFRVGQPAEDHIRDYIIDGELLDVPFETESEDGVPKLIYIAQMPPDRVYLEFQGAGGPASGFELDRRSVLDPEWDHDPGALIQGPFGLVYTVETHLDLEIPTLFRVHTVP